MDYIFITLRNKLRELENTRLRQITRLDELTGYEMVNLEAYRKKSGAEYYYTRKRCKVSDSDNSANARNASSNAGSKAGVKASHKASYDYRYLGDAAESEVAKIKEAHYLKKSLSAIEIDIKLCKTLIQNYEEYDYISINNRIPKVYRCEKPYSYIPRNASAEEWLRQSHKLKEKYGTYLPEKLEHPTADGNLVRSKSEVIIYNFLLSLGVTFMYERPVIVGGKIFYPDFTILSEIDNKTMIFIEHQGMMKDEKYRHDHAKKINDYIEAGFVPEKNLFFTYDIKGRGPDVTIIQDIISRKVRITL